MAVSGCRTLMYGTASPAANSAALSSASSRANPRISWDTPTRPRLYGREVYGRGQLGQQSVWGRRSGMGYEVRPVGGP